MFVAFQRTGTRLGTEMGYVCPGAMTRTHFSFCRIFGSSIKTEKALYLTGLVAAQSLGSLLCAPCPRQGDKRGCFTLARRSSGCRKVSLKGVRGAVPPRASLCREGQSSISF